MPNQVDWMSTCYSADDTLVSASGARSLEHETNMREGDVIQAVHTALRSEGLGGKDVTDLFVDAHPTLRGMATLRPIQRFTLALDGMTVHPDLVGRFAREATTFAIEATGEDDLLRGLAQAAAYRFGFHQSFLACAGPAPGDLVVLAREQHVGVLEIYPDRLTLTHLPPVHLPVLHHAQSVERQFSTTQTLRATFVFNIPTHYLSIALGVRGAGAMTTVDVERSVRATYPVLPSGGTSFHGALRGARQLGLVAVHDDQVALTRVGQAAVQLLPDLHTLAAIHTAITRSPRTATLAAASPAAGAVLRWLLAQDPVADLITTALAHLGRAVTMPELARMALSLDHPRALTVFFTPEILDEVLDTRGHVRWEAVEGRHYRSTTFMQVKSILKHAGLLMPYPLGGTSARTYRPDADRWELLAFC